MPLFRTLYIDMNAFFASVEQHEDPTLRGKPVAIVAVDGTAGGCVAVSYEAKRYGLKTGTPVWEAKRLCPDVVLLPSRHRLYARYNLRIADLLDRAGEVESIRSIDEFQIALGSMSLLEAKRLVQRMKASVAREISPVIRFSAGVGPNALLAKIAGKLEKPDGFAWLSPENMPERLAHLKLEDLPGISHGIRAKLYRAAIWDIPALYRLDPRHARMIWRSVEGERFVRALQGEFIPLVPTERQGYGNSKVLSPEFRRPREAFLVGRWLIEKATQRLRRDGRVAGSLALSVSFLPEGGWSQRITCTPSQDTSQFLKLHSALWKTLWAASRPRGVISLSVHLGHVSPLSERQGDFFAPLEPGRADKAEKLAALVDQINARYGRDTLHWGPNQPHPGFFERG